jgi:hypothetical protein
MLMRNGACCTQTNHDAKLLFEGRCDSGPVSSWEWSISPQPSSVSGSPQKAVPFGYNSDTFLIVPAQEYKVGKEFATYTYTRAYV